MSRLSEMAHNDPNRVIALGRAGSTHNEIHGNLLPFPNRDRQGLQKSWCTHMVCPNSSTSVTFCDVLGDILLHIGPPIQVAQIMVYLVTSWMDGQLGVVSFIQNFSSKLLTWRNLTNLFLNLTTPWSSIQKYGPRPTTINSLICGISETSCICSIIICSSKSKTSNMG